VVSDDERGRAASLAAAVVRAARKGGKGTRVRLTALAERLIEAAPRIPVRDLQTLRRQFPGLGPEEIADRLVSGAVKGTAAVGAGVGAAAMLPTPPAMPAELATETLAVAMVEYKLIAELHELYGLRVPGNARQRATVYLAEWSERRGIDVTKPSTVNTALGVGMKRELRQRLVRRSLRNLPTLTPFMVGAAVGAVLNRRDTRKLADRVREGLREHQVPWSELEAGAAALDAAAGPVLPGQATEGESRLPGPSQPPAIEP
jgi:hypothetical protein